MKTNYFLITMLLLLSMTSCSTYYRMPSRVERSYFVATCSVDVRNRTNPIPDNFLRNSFPLFRKLDRQEVPQLFQVFIFLKQQLIMRYLLTEYKRKLSMQPRIV